MSTNKRAANARMVRDAEALLDRRYFSLEPERWAPLQAALHAPARPNPRLEKLVQTPSVSQFLSQFSFRADPLARKQQMLKIRRDVRVVEGARLEIALAVSDGVLQISITVAKPTT